MSAVRTKKLWLDKTRVAEHGQYIFIYTSPKYNQIIYSLNRALKNERSIKQLPFLGKYTKPGSLRRDVWRPLATVAFPSGFQGLAAYQLLLEFRKRHELEWSDEEMVEAARHLRRERELDEDETKERRKIDNEVLEARREQRVLRRPVKGGGRPPTKGRPYWQVPTQLWTRSRRERAQIVMMTSKANSIADLSAVLTLQDEAAKAAAERLANARKENSAAIIKAQERIEEIRSLRAKLKEEGTEEAKAQYKRLKREKMSLRRAITKPDQHAAVKGVYSWLNDPTPPSKRGPGRIRRHQNTPVMSMEGVRIEWGNLLDHQYASSWPNSVKHHALPLGNNQRRTRNTPTTTLKQRTAPRFSEAIHVDPSESVVEEPKMLEEGDQVSQRRRTGPPELPPEERELPQQPPSSWLDRLRDRLKYGSR